jgi:hypothetical protein
MLDGLWRIDVVDDCGMSARGAVALRGGVISGIGDIAELSGHYDCVGDAVIGMVDLVLRATDAGGAVTEQRVQLHIQGRVGAGIVAASGDDLAEPGRHVALRFEHRSSWAPRAPVAAIPAQLDVPAAPAAARFDAVERIGQAAARAAAAPDTALDTEAAERVRARRKARLSLEIRENTAPHVPRRPQTATQRPSPVTVSSEHDQTAFKES